MLSIRELFDAVLMIAGVGFIFMGLFRNFLPVRRNAVFRAFLFSCAITGPSIVLHEFAHKFAAVLLGLQATFHAHYGFLTLGIVLKSLGFPLLFIVPGYVSISGAGTPGVNAIVAFSGPAVHLLLWRLAVWRLGHGSPRKKEMLVFFVAMREINKVLFFLNMLPIPPLDGFSVFRNLLALVW